MAGIIHPVYLDNLDENEINKPLPEPDDLDKLNEDELNELNRKVIAQFMGLNEETTWEQLAVYALCRFTINPKSGYHKTKFSFDAVNIKGTPINLGISLKIKIGNN